MTRGLCPQRTLPHACEQAAANRGKARSTFARQLNGLEAKERAALGHPTDLVDAALRDSVGIEQRRSLRPYLRQDRAGGKSALQRAKAAAFGDKKLPTSATLRGVCSPPSATTLSSGSCSGPQPLADRVPKAVGVAETWVAPLAGVRKGRNSAEVTNALRTKSGYLLAVNGTQPKKSIPLRRPHRAARHAS